jgi:hypothetical protein
MNTLKRFWFKFAPLSHPSPLNLGCGVTALSQSDAIGMLKQTVFLGRTVPHIREVIEDIDVSTLDQRHIIPNMGSPHTRGVWFPLGH